MRSSIACPGARCLAPSTWISDRSRSSTAETTLASSWRSNGCNAISEQIRAPRETGGGDLVETLDQRRPAFDEIDVGGGREPGERHERRRVDLEQRPSLSVSALERCDDPVLKRPA